MPGPRNNAGSSCSRRAWCLVTCERHHCIVDIGVSQVLRVSYRWQTESPRLLSQLECRGHGGVDHPSCLIWSAISSRHRLCSRRLSPWRSSDRSLQRGWRVWKRGCGLANRSDELQQSDAHHHHLPIPSNGPQIPFVRGPSVLRQHNKASIDDSGGGANGKPMQSANIEEV